MDRMQYAFVRVKDPNVSTGMVEMRIHDRFTFNSTEFSPQIRPNQLVW